MKHNKRGCCKIYFIKRLTIRVCNGVWRKNFKMSLIKKIGGVRMITIISIMFLLLCIWITFKVVPAILGFTFSVFLAILQIIGIIFLLPIIGLAFFLLDIIFIGGIIMLIKAII